MPLEELDLALMLLRGLFRAKGAEVAALAGPRIFLARIESVFAGSKFADHRFNSARLSQLNRGRCFGSAALSYRCLGLLDVGKLGAPHGGSRFLAFRNIPSRFSTKTVA